MLRMIAAALLAASSLVGPASAGGADLGGPSLAGPVFKKGSPSGTSEPAVPGGGPTLVRNPEASPSSASGASRAPAEAKPVDRGTSSAPGSVIPTGGAQMPVQENKDKGLQVPPAGILPKPVVKTAGVDAEAKVKAAETTSRSTPSGPEAKVSLPPKAEVTPSKKDALATTAAISQPVVKGAETTTARARAPEPVVVVDAFVPDPSLTIVPELDIYDADKAEGNVVTLDALRNPDSAFYKSHRTFIGGEGLRASMIESAARGVGVRAGSAYESRRINQLLESRWAEVFDRRFQFDKLMAGGGRVIPPVITEINNVEERAGPRFLYLTIGAYEIVKDAELAVRSPTWRDYLFLPVSDPRPPEGLEAGDRSEKSAWTAAVEAGWEEGRREARATFALQLNRLIRDFTGMQRYHYLARRGAISLPQVTTTSQRSRVEAGGNRVFIGEKTLRIAVSPKFSR
ncbi:type IV secretory system conjugative DNA transfer family protein [Microvirga puerhi]|uniref:Type IV secretion system DotC family protein n=1 Tax=Microvirga puerhi TaxID=2876078 RepID=A0ABS7VTL6_9HYPH|nr:type IV secretory system conjugative DNA transfer family protein [Microvirga puerhi]MBZ6078919.1 type IV secretion system DotC family protein [Microvirga puerhi]